LGVLGAAGARIGRAVMFRASARVIVFGALAMAVTFAIGAALGTAV
jgi:hypothetical protein